MVVLIRLILHHGFCGVFGQGCLIHKQPEWSADMPMGLRGQSSADHVVSQKELQIFFSGTLKRDNAYLQPATNPSPNDPGFGRLFIKRINQMGYRCLNRVDYFQGRPDESSYRSPPDGALTFSPFHRDDASNDVIRG